MEVGDVGRTGKLVMITVKLIATRDSLLVSVHKVAVSALRQLNLYLKRLRQPKP